MLALSIRQPYAEEILRGMKTVEYRSRKTGIVGQRFYIYAASKIPEQADTAKRFRKLGHEVGGLPTGVLVGTAKFAKCVPCKSRGDGRFAGYAWHFTEVRRLKRPRKPKKQPQPTWFNPV